MDRKKAMVQKIEDHLDQVTRDGFQPQLVIFRDQETKSKNCRVCQLPSEGPFVVSIFGRAVGTAYPYCIAMVCKDCSKSERKQQEFLDRVEARYKAAAGIQ